MGLATEVMQGHYPQLKVFLNFLIKKKVIKYSAFMRIKGPKFNSTLPRPLSKIKLLRF